MIVNVPSDDSCERLPVIIPATDAAEAAGKFGGERKISEKQKNIQRQHEP